MVINRKSEPHSPGQRPRAASQRMFGGIAGRYKDIKRRIADMLMRGDKDYAMLSALSREIGGMRQRIRADLQRRGAERKRRHAAKKARSVTLAAAGGSARD